MWLDLLAFWWPDLWPTMIFDNRDFDLVPILWIIYVFLFLALLSQNAESKKWIGPAAWFAPLDMCLILPIVDIFSNVADISPIHGDALISWTRGDGNPWRTRGRLGQSWVARKSMSTERGGDILDWRATAETCWTEGSSNKTVGPTVPLVTTGRLNQWSTSARRKPHIKL